MKLKRRTVAAIAAVIVISLAGLVLVQILLLQNARQLKEQAFRDNALTAMGTAASQLETREAVSVAFKFDPSLPGAHRISLMAVSCTDSQSMRLFGDSTAGLAVPQHRIPAWIDSGILHYDVPARQHVTIAVIDASTQSRVTLVDSEKAPGSYRFDLQTAPPKTREVFVRYSADSVKPGKSAVTEIRLDVSDSTAPKRSITSSAADSNRVFLVSQVVNNLLQGETTPIEQRVNQHTLDSVLRASLIASGIDLPFEYAVLTEPTDSIRLSSTDAHPASLKASDLRTRLFPNDVLAAPAELVVFFPDRSSYVTRQLIPLTAATTLFMLLIAGCFVYSIVTIVRQRRFAQLTVDYINNMTHEFKTPLSTVALACEALARPDVSTEADKVLKYEQMIREENNRMRTQVDKILQMAVLEEGDYELTISDIDVHSVIETLVRSVSLQVDQRQGALTTQLNAPNPVVAVDPMHLTNILANLLDNAIKYSPERPEIAITTANDSRYLNVTILDHGIGIPARDLPLVFDKYYRVRTGNVHNVKGFGIGLSYVKLMVEAMGGTISLKSEPGRGTEINLRFPTVG